jgi:hypothetical protein
LLKFNSS